MKSESMGGHRVGTTAGQQSGSGFSSSADMTAQQSMKQPLGHPRSYLLPKGQFSEKKRDLHGASMGAVLA